MGSERCDTDSDVGASSIIKEGATDVEDVKDETFVLLDEGSCPENIRFVSGLFASAGYEIKLSNRKYRTPEGIESFYQPSDGVMIGDSFFKYERTTGRR